MNSIFPVQMLITFAIVIVGCSEQKKSVAKTLSDNPRNAYENPSRAELNAPARASALKTNGLNEKQQHVVFLNEIKSRPDPVGFLESHWSEIWNPIFDEQWSSANEKTLSQMITSLESGNEVSFNLLLKESKEPWANNPESRKSAITIATAFAAIFSTPTTDKFVPAAELPRLFSKYRNQMPPTFGDVLICKMIIETSAFHESRPKMPDGSAVAWNELAKSKNPLYRLIALRIFRNFEVSQSEAETFYSAYFEESEEGVNRALLTALSTRSDLWTAKVISKIQAKILPN
jgi:hypothetical protein